MPEPIFQANLPTTEQTMRWLRANGVTEDASQIAADVTIEDDWIYYDVVTHHPGHAPLRDHRRIRHRVNFHDANRATA